MTKLKSIQQEKQASQDKLAKLERKKEKLVTKIDESREALNLTKKTVKQLEIVTRQTGGDKDPDVKRAYERLKIVQKRYDSQLADLTRLNSEIVELSSAAPELAQKELIYKWLKGSKDLWSLRWKCLEKGGLSSKDYEVLLRAREDAKLGGRLSKHNILVTLDQNKKLNFE